MDRARLTRITGICLILIAVLVGGFVYLRAEGPSSQKTVQSTKTRGFAWKPGHVYEYLLRYDTLQHAAAGFGTDEGIGGAMQLEATFELMAHEARSGKFSLSATLKDIKHAKLKMVDQFLWQKPEDAQAIFNGRRMFFEADASGRVSTITPPAGDDADTRLFAHTMQSLLTEMQLQLDTDGRAEWTVEEPTLFGVVASRYAQGKGASTFQRSRTRAISLRIAPLATQGVSHELTSKHDFVLNAERVLARLEGTEELLVKTDGKDLQRVSTRLSFTLARSAQVDLSRIARTTGVARALAEWNVTEESERDHLEQRIDGLTESQMLDMVLAMGAGAERTDQARSLWRATGLLMLNPALCQKLVPLATRADASQKLRALTLDLLASVSDEAATAAMTAILRSEQVRNDEAFPLYLQRLSTQTTPTEEAFSFVESVFTDARARADADTLFASAYTMGAMAQEAGAGSPQEKRALVELRASMASADEPDAIAHHVRALGNVGRDSVLGDVSRLRDHTDPQVREAVATALGNIRTPAAERELVGLVGDSTSSVQREAILSLYRRQAGPDMLSDLNHSLQNGVAEANVPFLLDVLKRLRKLDPQGVTQTLDVLLTSSTLSREHRDLVLALRNG